MSIQPLRKYIKLNVVLFSLLTACAPSQHANTPEPLEHSVSKAICKNFGPQSPRDIDAKQGENQQFFSLAPSSDRLNLCNIHFHKNAEHKAADFSIRSKDPKHGGYKCAMANHLSKQEMEPIKSSICDGLTPGDTIEVHWVYSSCDVIPGEGLASCLSDSCANPNLRVESQVFTLVNDRAALNFMNFDLGTEKLNGFYQPRDLPNNSGKAVEFLGSTTGPKFTQVSCSPMQVSWRVRPQCSKLDIRSLGSWCKDNVFSEHHAHGVRELVTELELLSKIK
jgi:hypothetical protein